MIIRRSFNMVGILCFILSDGILYRFFLIVVIFLVRCDWLIVFSGLCNIYVVCINEENYKFFLIILFFFIFSGLGFVEIDLFFIII